MKAYIYLVVLTFMVLMVGNVYASEFGEVDIHGFVSKGYLVTSDNNVFTLDSKKGSFEFNELGLSFMTLLTADLRLGVQLFARDSGAIGNDEIIIDWAYADYQHRNWLGLRVGKIKIPFGLYNENRDVDVSRTYILMPQGIYPEMLRDASIAMKGVGLYGDTVESALGSFSYQFIYGTMDIPDDGGSSVLARNNGATEIHSIEADYSIVAHLKWLTPLDGFSAVASFRRVTTVTKGIAARGPITAPFTQTFHHMDFICGGIEYLLDELVLSAEYNYIDAEAEMALEVSPFFSLVRDMSRWPDGWHISLAYRFFHWFMPGMYFSEAYASTSDRKNQVHGSDSF